LQALQRTHAAAGNLSSGNADTDTLKYATDQAGKAYNSFAAGLAPYLGATLARLLALPASIPASAAGLNASYQGQGGAANANYTGQGAIADAAATMNNYNVGSKSLARLPASALLLGGLGGAGGLGGLTGGFGGSGFSLGPTSVGGAPVGGGLFSMFK
jgi:hypothetical protein